MTWLEMLICAGIGFVAGQIWQVIEDQRDFNRRLRELDERNTRHMADTLQRLQKELHEHFQKSFSASEDNTNTKPTADDVARKEK